MDEHKWTDEGLAFRAKPAGIYPGQPVSADPMTLMRRVAREILRLAGENALLRRERTLLIELEKARTRILQSISTTGGGFAASDAQLLGELMARIEALHLEASGGVQRPEGVPCACVLCRPEGALQREEDASAAREVAGLIERAIVEHLPEPGFTASGFICGECRQECDTLMGGRCAACARHRLPAGMSPFEAPPGTHRGGGPALIGARREWPPFEMGTCTACGEEREVFEGRCHDCISAGRRGKED